MLRAIIVDDEESARETLTLMLQKFCPQVQVIAEAGTIVRAVGLIRDLRPELVFLDIHLPTGTGFDVLEQLTAFPFHIVFTTAYNQYALKAIKFSALDYLLKPIHPEELQKAVQQAVQRQNQTLVQDQFKHFVNQLQTPQKPSKIVIPTTDGFAILPVETIIRCEGEKNYTIFYLDDHSKIVVSKTLKEYEDLLQEHDFLRIFKSHLINLAHVRRYIKGRGGEVVMSDGKQLPVSRERKVELLEKLNTI